MKILRTLAAGAALSIGALALAQPAAAAVTFTLTNTNGGDGYVTGVSTSPTPEFTIVSDTDGAPTNYTEYTTTAPYAGTWEINYTYTSAAGGSYWTPAGIMVGTTNYLLSPESSPSGASNSGSFNFVTTVGETVDFYVYTYDGAFGAADLAIDVTAVPEPATWAMMLLGVGGLGALARRRRAQLSSANAMGAVA